MGKGTKFVQSNVLSSMNIWECIECGLEWVFNDGTPIENNTNYCPSCGEEVIECLEDETIKYTKSPWKVVKIYRPSDGVYSGLAKIENLDGKDITEAMLVKSKEQETNMKLMAASPDIYEALKSALEELDNPCTSLSSFYKLRNQIHRAIDKVEGNENTIDW